MTGAGRPCKVAVFASGGGSNFQSLVDHSATDDLWRVALLIMNREAGAAERARRAGIPVRIVATRDRPEAEVEAETLALLDEFGIEVVLLAGYLRRIPAGVTRRYGGRMLNVHPALLPDFGGPGMYGMNVHRAVAESDAPMTGVTIHFVNERYDDGAILAQWEVPRHAGDTAEEIAARVLEAEHRLYPAAVDHLCAALRDGRTPERLPTVRSSDEAPSNIPSVSEPNEDVR